MPRPETFRRSHRLRRRNNFALSPDAFAPWLTLFGAEADGFAPAPVAFAARLTHAPPLPDTLPRSLTLLRRSCRICRRDLTLFPGKLTLFGQDRVDGVNTFPPPRPDSFGNGPNRLQYLPAMRYHRAAWGAGSAF